MRTTESGVISWVEYFMEMAKLASRRSKDPNTQVGAVLVSSDNRVISTGYNGLPRGYVDSDFGWSDVDESGVATKYPYVVHAELNAILSSKVDLESATMYVTLFPCSECAKSISQSEVTKLIYLDDKYADRSDSKASREILTKGGVDVVKYSDLV